MVVGDDHRKSCKAFSEGNTESSIGKEMNEPEEDNPAAQEQKDRNSDEAGRAGSYELFDALRALDSIIEFVDDFHTKEEILAHTKEEIESTRREAVHRAMRRAERFIWGVSSTPCLDYLDYLDYCHSDIDQSNARVDVRSLYNQKLDRAKKESLLKKEAFNMLLNSLDEEQKTIVGKELSSLSYDQLIKSFVESFEKNEYSVLDAYRLLFSKEQVLASFTDEQMELLKSTRWYMGGR